MDRRKRNASNIVDMYVSIFLTVLPTPQESLAAVRPVQDKDALPTTDTRGGTVANAFSFSMSNLEDFPSLGAVSSQKSATDTTRATTLSAWTTRTDAFGRFPNQVLPSAKATIMPSQMAEVNSAPSNQMSNSDTPKNTSFLSTCPTRPDEGYQITDASVAATEQSPTDTLINANSSAWASHINASGRTAPALPLDNSSIVASQMVKGSSVSSMNPGAEQSANTFSNPRKIPKGVFVVCDDFLQKNLKRAASIAEKIKTCKGCENRAKLRYAVWNGKSKQWQIIRPYPEKVSAKVAFSECRQYVMNTPCPRTQCSFAHGQEELLMWTLEREGSKFMMSAIYSCLSHLHE